MAADLAEGQILLLENSRFEEGERKMTPSGAGAGGPRRPLRQRRFWRRAPGARHHRGRRPPASRLRGLLLERELEQLTAVVESPERPLVVVLGGAKVSDKVGVIDRFLGIADEILIGGAMCFVFFRAQGIETGNSLVEDEGSRSPGRRSRRRRTRIASCSSRPISCSGGSSPRTPSTASPTAPRCPTAGWASTSGRRPPAPTPNGSRCRNGVMEWADGRF